MSSQLSESCGRMFEVCFNCGIMVWLQQQGQQLKQTYGSLYTSDLERLRFTPMAAYAIRQAKTIGPSPKLRRVAEQVLFSFAFRGFLAGYHFLEEYLHTLKGPYEAGQIQVRYVQCSFREQNSFGMIPTDPGADRAFLRQCLSQLDPELRSEQLNIDFHSETGRFLKADTLLLLQWGGSKERDSKLSVPLPCHWRIVCCDLSIHSMTQGHLRDPNNILVLRQLLQSELSYLRSQGVFSNLSLDVEQEMPENLFASGLETYLTAFKKKGKESAKLIQAGGYAYDFYKVLCEQGMIHPHDDVSCNIFGITDRGINAMHVKQEHMSILETCQRIYQRTPHNEDINRARDEVIQAIRSNAASSFTNASSLLDELVNIDRRSDGCFWLTPYHEVEAVLSPKDPLPSERINSSLLTQIEPHFTQTHPTIQDAHTLLVQQALASDDPYLFLTGNPGIGKTTAIVEYLKDRERQKEGFLFLYVSPRKQVNLDLIEKFCLYENGPLSGSILALTTNATLLEGRTEPAVAYRSAVLATRGTIVLQGVKTMVSFLEMDGKGTFLKPTSSHRLSSLLDDQIWDRGERSFGVLNSICQALAANMQTPLSDAVVATLSIQALKKLGGASDTLAHLDKIFACARVGDRGRILPDRMQSLATRMPHLIFMIDEVTGDEGGVAFLSGLHTFATKYGLFAPTSPFHTKIIVADASIVDRSIITRHLSTNTYEPEKIYFQHVRDKTTLAPLTQEPFRFKNQSAIQLNANTYPARNLHLAYHICLECSVFEESFVQTQQNILRDTVQERMCEELLALIAQPQIVVPQVLVYIQDKRRLSKMIAYVKKQLPVFRLEEEYLEIHANISTEARSKVAKKRKTVRVVFMTASASRGLSFPEATHFLIDVPRFEIEMNVMEILQVMYRGRGGDHDLEEKYVQFYLSDQVVYYQEEDRARSLRERALGLLNILLILKTSIMTRVSGAGQVGRHQFMMVPISGKSVSSAGGTFPDIMADVIHQLMNESRTHPERQDVQRVGEHLQKLFGEGMFNWTQGKSSEQHLLPYLPQRRTLVKTFHELITISFSQLFTWPKLEQAYMTGGMLVVPTHHKNLEQSYLFDLRNRLRTEEGKKIIGLLWHLETTDLPEQLQSDIKKVQELLSLLQAVSDKKTQQLVQGSQFFDQYYAVPVFAFQLPEVFEDYFSTTQDILEPFPFRTILGQLIRTWYPTNTLMPIGGAYKSYPFVVFRSFNLEEVRRRIFSGTSLFVSYEMNVLNMLLSAGEKTEEQNSH